MKEKGPGPLYKWIFPFALAALGAALYLCAFLPIYTDEIGVLMTHARIFADQGFALSLHPSCEPPVLRIPWVIYPLRWLDAALYGTHSSPQFLRWMGILKWLLWLLLTSSLVRTVWRWSGHRGCRAAFAWAVLPALLGIFPFLLVVNRPEQAFLLGITGVLALAVFPPRWLACRKWARTALLVAAAEYMFAEHAKAVFFLPFLLGSFFLIPAGRHRWAGIAGVLVIAYVSISFYSRTLACPGDVYSRGRLVTTSILVSPEVILSHPMSVLARGLGNLTNPEYLAVLGFNFPRYSNLWLPAHPHFRDEPFRGVNLEVTLFYLALLIGALAGLFSGGAKQAKGRLRSRERRAWIAACLLAISLAGNMFASDEKNFYESALIVPGWILVFYLGAASWPGGRAARERFLERALALSCALVLLSQVALFQRFHPFVASWAKGGDIPYMNYSFSGFGFGKHLEEMKAFYASCGLAPSPSLRHVVVDDMTYAAFAESNEPYHIMYLSKYWGLGIPDLRKFLREHASDGIAVRCRHLTMERDADLLAAALKQGDYCCLPRSKL